jgi:hypothetical protein
LHTPDICPDGQQQQFVVPHMAKVMHGPPVVVELALEAELDVPDGTHDPPEHMNPAAQSAVVPQVVAQADVPAHT